MAKKIRIPKTPQKAFDRNRPPNTLIRNHIAHLEHAVLSRGQSIRTEVEAAEYVAQLTSILRGDERSTPKANRKPARRRKK
jgi:hypothetical protein